MATYLLVKQKKKIRLRLLISFEQFKLSGKLMAITLVPNQTVDVTLMPVDRHGKPAGVENVVFTSDNTDVFTVEQSADNPLKATVTSKSVGVAKLTYSADGDLDSDEVKTIGDFVAVEVKPEDATGFNGITVGTPVDIDTTPTPTPVTPTPTDPVAPVDTPVEPAPVDSTPTEPTPETPSEPTTPSEAETSQDV